MGTDEHRNPTLGSTWLEVMWDTSCRVELGRSGADPCAEPAPDIHSPQRTQTGCLWAHLQAGRALRPTERRPSLQPQPLCGTCQSRPSLDCPLTPQINAPRELTSGQVGTNMPVSLLEPPCLTLQGACLVRSLIDRIVSTPKGQMAAAGAV